MKRTCLFISILMTTAIISCGELGEDTSTTQSIRLYNSEPIHLYAWGKNENGQLGNGESGIGETSVTPVVIGSRISTVFEESAPIAEIVDTALKTKNWQQVSAGQEHTAAITDDGILFAWGRNNVGQLGTGNTDQQNTPFQIGDKTWAQVSAGGSHTVAIDSDDYLFAWGAGTNGQLGTGNNDNQNAPVKIGTDTWKQVSAGGTHTVAIDSDDYLFAWGAGTNGQLGTGNTNNQNAPVKIGTDTWKQVSAGGTHTVAIMSDGLLYAWGANNVGQLGDGNGGSLEIQSNSPVQIGTDTWKQVSAGGSHTVAIMSDGTLYAWGNNTFGQLGNDNTDDQSVPAKIGDKTWVQVSAGAVHTVAIDSADNLFGWGENNSGQLGNGESGEGKKSTTPVAIEASNIWKQASAGFGYTVAILK